MNNAIKTIPASLFNLRLELVSASGAVYIDIDTVLASGLRQAVNLQIQNFKIKTGMATECRHFKIL
jgi:hypothetical protein